MSQINSQYQLHFYASQDVQKGRLDIICNNAGIFEDIPFSEQSDESIQRIIRINIDGVVNCSKVAFPALQATKGAKLINIASAASIYGVPNEVTYSASKFFVRGFSEGLKLEWEKEDIDVSVIMPSYVKTPMIENNQTSWEGRFGVSLNAEDVASSIWKASNSSKLYWCLPGSTRLLMSVMRKIPMFFVPRMAKKIFFG